MSQPRADDALTILDERPATGLYWKLGVLATVGGFLFGYDTSDIGSALNFVPYGLHGLALGYLVSGASLGAAAGAILGGPTADRFGRKRYLATGGVYLGGGIAPKILPRLRDGAFIRAFTAKGRFAELLEQIPVHVILNDKTALLGAARYARAHEGVSR